MKASICMSAYQRPTLLRRTLESIYRQDVPFEFETIVVDDDNTLPQNLLDDFPQVRWMAIRRPPGIRNPGPARNMAYKAARGEVLICQSEEVLHVTPDCIERLVTDLKPGTCLIATVHAMEPDGTICPRVMGAIKRRRRPFFFLGSIYRSDMYAIGGNDEDFIAPGEEDKWFALCLVNGLKLTPVYSREIVGHHQYHVPYLEIYHNHGIYRRKHRIALETGKWTSSGGPWEMET